MKLSKLLIPLGMLFALPLCSCTPSNVQNVDNKTDNQQEDKKEEEKKVVLSISEVVEKLEKTFDIKFEYDDFYQTYSAVVETDKSLQKAVSDAVAKIDFLTLDGEIAQSPDGGGYEAFMYNEDGTVCLNVYSSDDNGKTLEFDVFSQTPSTETKSWSDINFASYISGFNGTVPAPSAFTSIEFEAGEGYVMVDVFGASLTNYLQVLKNNDYEVDYSQSEYGFYYAYDNADTITLMLFDDPDYGSMCIIAYPAQEE